MYGYGFDARDDGRAADLRMQPELSHHERGRSRAISRVRRAATPAEGNAH
eukprot:CAMPEP_0185418674 /NCGR_PEP_ID=MMETSP1365-20130426/8966_1 /TAXON_ID=38817 /ORGANISM="Gephyrocapsa oceanica, Strain RCC1303" /LENGTH=49 /DNA_ID= /DNA_START= /DNA_END= /DNA_ORIENTATION=